ncbi:MAG: nitrile hydratase subunit beta [Xanthobacteraceae bacterium]
MDGVHDMGGMDGFGPVQPEENEPVFHEKWEGRVLAMNRAMGFTRTWNGDISRHAKEILPPHVYLASPYYRRWALGLEQMLMDHGLVDADEFAAGHVLRPGKPLKRKLTLDQLEKALLARGSYERPARAPALFKAGDRVRAKNIHPKGHTRLPRYVRGHVGAIERVHGCHVFPDSHAARREEDPQWLYTVRFEGRELWGDKVDPTIKVSVDAFEPYLERA